MRNHEKSMIAKTAGLFMLGALAIAGGKWVMGDEYPHPIAGRVDAVSEPSWECRSNGKFTTCDYHYYIFVNGCVELPADVQEYVDERTPERDSEYGWVEVGGDTWSHQQAGGYVEFGDRNVFQRVLADQTDSNHLCPIPAN